MRWSWYVGYHPLTWCGVGHPLVSWRREGYACIGDELLQRGIICVGGVVRDDAYLECIEFVHELELPVVDKSSLLAPGASVLV